MSKKKKNEPKKAYQRVTEYKSIDIPWEVYCFLPHDGVIAKEMEIYGDQIGIGGDFMNLAESQTAIQWFVDQLGGKVQWKEKNEK